MDLPEYCDSHVGIFGHFLSLAFLDLSVFYNVNRLLPFPEIHKVFDIYVNHLLYAHFYIF